MTTQINLRISEDFLKKAKDYAKKQGYLNVQEFIREATRQKLFEDSEIKKEYLETLYSKEAVNFLSDKEADDLDKELAHKLKNHEKKRTSR